MAPTRRKFFEGSVWIDSLIRSDGFTSWVGKLTDEERLDLWKAINQRKPIYGDDFFARPILFSIARALMDTAKLPDTAKSIVEDLALASGVFLKVNESMTLINNQNASSAVSLGNIRVTPVTGACSKIVEACKFMKGGSTARAFMVSCNHSGKVTNAIHVDCDALPANNFEGCADLIVNVITSACEARGDFEFALSNGERASLLMLRSLKKRLPGKLKTYLRHLKDSKRTSK